MAGEHTPDDWAVWKSFGYNVGRVSRVTAAQVRVVGYYGERERCLRKDQVVFRGTEKACRDLVSVLGGLDRRHVDGVKRLGDEHQERVTKAIARATPAEGE